MPSAELQTSRGIAVCVHTQMLYVGMANVCCIMHNTLFFMLKAVLHEFVA